MNKYYVYKLGKNKTLLFTINADSYFVAYGRAEFFETEITTRVFGPDVETKCAIATVTLPSEFAVSEQEL